MSKYPALSFFKVIYGLAGYLIIGGGLLFSVFFLLLQDGFLVGLAGVIVSLLVGASILVTSELLGLMMDVEQHLSHIRFNQSNNQTISQKTTSASSPSVPAPSVFKQSTRSPKLGKFDPPSG